ncbi:transcriptional regulator [Thermus scotoductus]|uniref:Transcriptional regulator n=1 Tax=Thermus scotoductus TaxID=37636 RepID=A0A430UYW5_THESC|nr:transcriptional regulator [Thermus scotoductus]RTH98277.1 transcriptional regulator [Thermus scotoductus]RTI14727.1 transcriptional regulator [Thermus scotoductus]
MSRGSALPDFIRLLSENPGGLSWHELADKLGVTRQTVYRLREKAQSQGIWVLTHKEDPSLPPGWFRLENPKEVEDLFGLTRQEVEALKAAVSRVEHLTPLAKKALEKLGRGRPKVQAEEPVVYTPLADEYPEGLFERVVRAIRGRRTCEVTYKNAKGEAKTYRFDPYALIARDPHLYLVGANHNSRKAGHDPIKDLRLDQVLELRLTPERFKKPDFDVKAYAQNRFRAFAGEGKPVRVRVRFSPEKAGYIRRTRRHPTQVVEDLPDGSVIWQVEVPLSEDLVHFIVGYGPHARVLEPEELRKRVVAWAQGTVEANASPEGVTRGVQNEEGWV